MINDASAYAKDRKNNTLKNYNANARVELVHQYVLNIIISIPCEILKMFDFEDKITTLFLKICIIFQLSLQFFCQRFTITKILTFTDEEIVTIYLMGIIEGRRTVKSIYYHAKSYWKDLFPNLPSYAAYNYRINRLEGVFPVLLEYYQSELPQNVYNHLNHRVVDSVPIVMAQNNRRFKASVAPELADKGGYCAAKNLHYGTKLHILASYQVGSMPVPEYIGLTNAQA
ncbi:hypothetical protein [Cysteiniphilum halobium]|uniref:hypothetical protein n=1 Tax=Cysteiniphilum halobium TaxID=2219059 RepID=UPI003F87B2A8